MKSVKKARLRLIAAVVLVGTALAGCVTNGPQDTLKPVGPEARRVDNLAERLQALDRDELRTLAAAAELIERALATERGRAPRG